MSPAQRTALWATASGGVLLLAAPGPVAALRTLQTAARATDPRALLVAAVALIAWALVLWLGTLVALTLASRLPGLGGRVGGALGRCIAPAAVRRTVEVALGLSLAVTAVAASPASASPPAGPGAAAGTAALPPTAAGPPSLDWAAPAGPSLDWPSRPGAAATALTTAALPTTALPTTAHPTPAAAQDGAPVVVRPGDTLWGLAEQSLRKAGAAPTSGDVARTWPSWWAANRDVVGDDPHLLRPGTPLSPPRDTTPDRPPYAPSTDSGGSADGAAPASS